MNLFKKLSAAETRRLASFLESIACPPDTMSLMETKGFLFALCSAPVMALPSTWIPEIFNNRTPNFATTEEESFINTALVRLYNQIMSDVVDGVPTLPAACKYREPCESNFADGAPLHEWSRGFNAAHHLYFDHWEQAVGQDDELMAAVGFMVLTLGFFDDRDESRQMLDMAFDVDLPLHEMAPIVRGQMPQVMKEYARIGRALYEEILEQEHMPASATQGSAPASNVVPFRVPHRQEDARDRLLQAEELAIQAMDETSHDKRVALARKALSISDECAQALILLAEHAAENLEESANYYFRAMQAVRHTMGEEMFGAALGHFWGVLETRPYMRAKLGYADTLWAMGRQTEAISEYEQMLQLNPDDNQGVRYVLLLRYLDVSELDKADGLIRQYDEVSTWWSFSRALLAFLRDGDTAASRKLRTQALRSNAHLLNFFSGKRRMPRTMPDTYSPGSLDEAVLYAHEGRMTWRSKPGAVEWLQAGVKPVAEKPAAARVAVTKATTAKATTAKASTAKASTAKASTAKASTAKATKTKAAAGKSASPKATPKTTRRTNAKPDPESPKPGKAGKKAR